MTDRCTCGVRLDLIHRDDVKIHQRVCGLVPAEVTKPQRRRTAKLEAKRRYYWRNRERLLSEGKARGWGKRRTPSIPSQGEAP